MTDWSKSDIALDSCREDFVRGATSSHFPFIRVRGGEALGGLIQEWICWVRGFNRQEWTGLVELQGQNHLSVDETLKLLLSLCFQFRLFKFDKFHYFSCPGLVSQSGIAILEFEDTKIIPDTSRPRSKVSNWNHSPAAHFLYQYQQNWIQTPNQTAGCIQGCIHKAFCQWQICPKLLPLWLHHHPPSILTPPTNQCWTTKQSLPAKCQIHGHSMSLEDMP